MVSPLDKGKAPASASSGRPLEQRLAETDLDHEEADEAEDDELADDISDWEIEEGVPQFSDQFIQQYLSGREALIEQEKSQRSDNAFQHSLTPLAKEACSILSNILDEERLTIWNSEHPENLAEKAGITLFPGMPFSLARERMEKTKSWRIVKNLPKGALLHAHMDATLDVDFVIEKALASEGMAISTNTGLIDASSLATAEVFFRYRKAPDRANAASIWTKDANASEFFSMREAAATFPDGGLAGFKTWLKGRCTITGPESLEHHHGVDHVWQRFANCFLPLNSLEYYEPVFRPALQHMLSQIVQDGIRWVDFRSVFIQPFFLTGHEKPCEDNSAFLQIWDDEVKSFQRTEEGKSFWGARFIWTSLRFWPKKQIIQHMKDCIEMKVQFADLICGYDLVGQEDAGRPLADLTPELFWFKKKCMEAGVEIPFFFHAGECLGDGDATDQNLFDAVLLGTRRIGHGFSLYKHPLLTEMVKTKKILVESCPISNEVLRLTSSIKAHPLPALLARGVSCCLANDDPGILGHGNSGVTHDFWQALQGWENLGLAGLGSLAENSVRWAAYAPDQAAKVWVEDVKKGVHGQGVRAERMREWTAEWNKFCEWIVLEYGIEYGGGEDDDDLVSWVD